MAMAMDMLLWTWTWTWTRPPALMQTLRPKYCASGSSLILIATRAVGEPPRVAYERRKDWYTECADLDHLAAPGESAFEASCERLIRMLQRARGEIEPAAMPHDHSFVVSLSFADLAPVLPLPAALWTNADAVELRCDLLHSLEPAAVQRQIALLKRDCPLPIIFTVRSKSEGGAFGGSPDQYLQLNTLALR